MWLSRLRTRLASLRMQVQSLALLSALRIWHCFKLWCRSQMQLGSCIAVAVHRPAAAALIWPLVWEPPYAMGVAKHTHTHTHPQKVAKQRGQTDYPVSPKAGNKSLMWMVYSLPKKWNWGQKHVNRPCYFFNLISHLGTQNLFLCSVNFSWIYCFSV